MAEKQLFAELILPLLLEKTYTYSVPETLVPRCQPGKRAIAQFGPKKYYTGLIINVGTEPPLYPVKEINDIIDERSITFPEQIEFWKWISSYYMCTLGEVFKAALPSGLKLESETRVKLHPAFDDLDQLTEKERIICKNLASHESLSLEEIATLIEQKSAAGIVKRLIEKFAVYTGEEIRQGWKPKTETLIYLSPEYPTEEKIKPIFDSLVRAPEQLKLFMAYLSQADWFNGNQNRGIEKKQLLLRAGVSSQILQAVLKKQFLIASENEIGRLDFSQAADRGLRTLSSEQLRAKTEIQRIYNEKDVCLLHGVTSSGKTEIYFHLINEVIESGKQVLFLLPEIALTTQMISRVKEVFGAQAGVYHSRFPDSERVEIWKNLLGQSVDSESYKLIVGVRSSVFLPFQNLGLIIIDEEHEPSFKQNHPAPRYNARDAALVLALKHNAKTLYGTATPSLEVYSNCMSGKFGLVWLPLRHLNMELPEILIADQKRARKRKQMKSIFTPELFEAINTALSGGEQVILFQNRRGFAPYLECPECGWVVKCENCDVSLTYHRSVNALVCHYCSSAHPIPQSCLACGAPGMLTRGIGTERVEEETRLMFEKYRVERMDIDSTRSRHSFENLLEAFEKGEIHILVGTQMISKGLDFDKVSVVGILDADAMLNFPDFRAFERSYQLMSQVAGRAGRKGRRGTVIIQTSVPDHSIIQQVVNSDYNAMFNIQSHERHLFGYPPYTRLIRITLKHKNRDLLNAGSHWFASTLRAEMQERVIGPDFPLISRIQNFFIKNILIKVEREKSPAQVKHVVYRTWIRMKSHPEFRSMIVVFDVDPV